jgi:hypothetical protein
MLTQHRRRRYGGVEGSMVVWKVRSVWCSEEEGASRRVHFYVQPRPASLIDFSALAYSATTTSDIISFPLPPHIFLHILKLQPSFQPYAVIRRGQWLSSSTYVAYSYPNAFRSVVCYSESKSLWTQYEKVHPNPPPDKPAHCR